jgi:hypothetical protein
MSPTPGTLAGTFSALAEALGPVNTTTARIKAAALQIAAGSQAGPRFALFFI